MFIISSILGSNNCIYFWSKNIRITKECTYSSAVNLASDWLVGKQITRLSEEQWFEGFIMKGSFENCKMSTQKKFLN